MPRSFLTDSEYHIMQSLAFGKTLDEIASSRGAQYTTIRNMLTRVVDKIEAESTIRPDKTGAVVWLLEQQIISYPEFYDPLTFKIATE